MKVITQKQWNEKKQLGYTYKIKDQNYILTLKKEGTCLIPVEIGKWDKP